MTSVAAQQFSTEDEEISEFPKLEETAERVNCSRVKRLMDIVVSGFALLLLSPLLIVIAIIIKLTSPTGPVFFVCQRFGRGSRIFPMYKFRTMYPGAEKEREALMHLNEMSGAAFKLSQDPRVYPFGAFLRKYSLDELPQLFNVFRGEMSLVGPRPFLQCDEQNFKPWHYKRHLVRPGVTSLWQIQGRNKISNFDDWAKLDLQYIQTWSFWKDIKIILSTIPVLLRGTGQ